MAIGKPILERSSQAQKRSRTQILTPSDPKISGKEPKTLSKGAHNPLLKEAGLTKPTAAHPSGGPVQYCSARILPSGAFRRNLKKLSKSMIIPLARSLHLAHLITSQHGPRQGRTQFDSVMPRCPENDGQRSTLTLSKLSDELKLPLPLPI